MTPICDSDGRPINAGDMVEFKYRDGSIYFVRIIWDAEKGRYMGKNLVCGTVTELPWQLLTQNKNNLKNSVDILKTT